MTQGGGGVGGNSGGSSGGSEAWADKEYILKVEVTGFSDGLL